LPLDGKRALDVLDRVPAMPIDKLHELAFEPAEDLLDLCGREPFFVFVEQNVVGVVCLGKAGDVAALELELTLEMGPEGLEVLRAFRVVPRGYTHAARLDHLADELGWDPPRSLPLAPRDPDQRSLDRVGIVACGV